MTETVKWPGGAQCAVLLSFDFDAETLWLARDPSNIKKRGTLSQGTYGAKVGVPRILELLEETGLKATFFVPGWTAERHTSQVEAIVAGGHEVGHHGYLHEWPDPDEPALEEEYLDKGLEALQKTVGVRPVGYRAPAGEISDNMLRLLTEKGFLYDSSLMDQIDPYRHTLEDGTAGPVELPWHWSIDDAVYTLFSVRTPRAIATCEHILTIWQDEFREIYRWGGLFDLVMHPQFIGRPSRLAMLREFIAWTRRFPGVWYATGREIAEAWVAQAE